MDITGKSLRRLRAQLGKNQQEFAKMIGVGQGRYSKWERGENEPSAKYVLRIQEIARSLNAPANNNSGVVPLGSGQLVVRTIRIIGDLQAGAWREAIEWAPDDQYDIAITPPPGLEGYNVQGFIVRGDSMNTYYPDGTIVFIEPTISTGKVPKSGQHVLVSRRNRNGMYEATLKEYVVNEDGSKWLWPRSKHPEHQAPIAYRDSNTEEVTITGILRGAFVVGP